jgi:CheY-like chemotaxis protein
LPASSHNRDARLGAETHSEEENDRAQLVQAEVARLCAHAVWQAVDMDEVLREVQQVVSAVAAAQGVALVVTADTGLLVPRADAILLRQAILNVLTYGLDRASGGQLLVTPLRQQNVAGITIRAEPAPQLTSTARASALPARQGVGLLISQQLMTAMGGELLTAPFPSAGERPSPRTAQRAETWAARLIWSTNRAPVLLVIDDNEGLLQLFRRYLAGYTWQVIGVTDGEQARSALEQFRPTVIILDVMMPKEDGWAILQQLKADPATATIPVMICSVLNEPQLARSLGAAAYLPKPVKQRVLLQALARWWPTPANLPSTHQAAVSATE